MNEKVKSICIFVGIILAYFILSQICLRIADEPMKPIANHSDEEGSYYDFDNMNKAQAMAFGTYKYALNFPLGIPSWFLNTTQSRGEGLWMQWTVWTFIPNSLLVASFVIFIRGRRKSDGLSGNLLENKTKQ